MKNDKFSPCFTIDDIHEVRERNYEQICGMSVDEKNVYYNEKGMAVENEIARLRKKSLSVYGVAEDNAFKTFNSCSE